MLDPVSYGIWLAVILAEVSCLVCMIRARAFTEHFTLLLYLCSCLANEIGANAILKNSGFDSDAYYYYFFYSKSVLAICLYFVLMNLYSHVFSEMGAGKYIRGGAAMILAGTAGISYYLVTASSNRMITHFAVELAQNLYFVGVILTYLLWFAMAKLRENRTRVAQLVLSMGVYVSLSAGSYALSYLYPDHDGFWKYYFPITSMWLPLSWAYTFLKVPKDARLATAKVLAPNA